MNAKTEQPRAADTKAGAKAETNDNGFRRYRVAAGVAHFGPGQLFELTNAQIDPRKQALEPIERTGSERGIVRATALTQFKIGEEVGLPDLPKNLTDILEPIGEPISDADRMSLHRAHTRAVAEEAERVAAVKAKAAKRHR